MRQFVKILTLSLLLGWTSLSFAAATTSKHLWNLENADIRAVIAAVSKATNKNFIVDPRVQGKISIISNQPISGKAAYQMFLSSLQVLGFAAVPADNAVKIVPNVNAKDLAAPVADTKHPGTGDELITQVVPVSYVSALQLVPILRPLLPQWSNISAYAPANIIIITGRANNVNRLIKIIHRADRAGSDQVEIINLKHANASKLVATLSSLQSAERSLGRTPNISLVADDQGNRILLSGSKAERVHIRVLIAELDNKATGENGNTKVIHLKYLDAKKLAPVLAKVAHSAYVNVNSKIKAQANTASDSSVAIEADETTNSIIISAPAATIKTLTHVVMSLDSRPSQVLVEAIIAEVDESLVQKLGVTWGTGTNSDLSSSDLITPGLGMQSGIGMLKSGSLRILMAALQGSSSANILSTPSIVVLNNHKANIKVGKNVGLQNREYSTDAQNDSSTPFTTVERTDVALKLNVTPHITPDNTISMKIEQDNNTLQDPNNPGDNPVINTNQIKTAVMIGNGDILVLGGLISHDNNNNYSKVPFFGDLPLLGNLFKYKNKSVEKKDLLMFIRPLILSRGNIAKHITENRYEYMRQLELLKRRGYSLITNLNEQPLMRPLKKPVANLPVPFANQ